MKVIQCCVLIRSAFDVGQHIQDLLFYLTERLFSCDTQKPGVVRVWLKEFGVDGFCHKSL